MRAKGVDLWRGQGNVDFPRLATWADFVQIRGSVGRAAVDGAYPRYLHGARGAGLPIASVYHAFGTESPAAEQAANAIALWHVHGAPIALDLESPDPPFSPMIGQQRCEDALDFIFRCETAGARVLVYTYPYFAQQLPYCEELLELVNRPLWIASYHNEHKEPADADQPTVPPPWSDWLFWQWSGDHGTAAPGVSVVVDHNMFSGTKDDFLAWLAGPQAA